MAECRRMIGDKDHQRPCGLPVRRDDLCNYHWLSQEAQMSRKRRSKVNAAR